MDHPLTRLLAALAVLAAAGCAGAADTSRDPATSSPESTPAATAAPETADPESAERARVNRLADAQEALAAGDGKRAIALLTAWTWPDSALRQLLLGHAHLDGGDAAAAEKAYRAALAQDPATEGAALGLASALCNQERWSDALVVFGAAADPATAPLEVLRAWAHTAWAAEDRRIAGELARTGLLRFPHERAFRTLDLALLLDGGRWAEAADSARSLLTAAPDDAPLWGQLGYALARAGRAPEALDAWEAAWRCAPEDPECLYRHAAEQLASGQPDGALSALRPWLEANATLLASAPERSRALTELGLRAALDCGDRALARALVAPVLTALHNKTDSVSVTVAVAIAQVESADGDLAGARAVLDAVVHRPGTGAGVIAYAASLAEQAGDRAAAESLFALAAVEDSTSGRVARLHRARLLAEMERRDEARAVLEQHLAADPGDTTARAMLDTLGTP